MEKYIQGSGDLSAANVLREGYVPKIGCEEELRLKAVVKDQRVLILCDETTDRKGQCVFVVLIKVLGCRDDSLDIQYGNIVSVTSDSVRYMDKCTSAVRILVPEELLQTQCWAHKLNLVGNVWANTLLMRKHAYIQFLTGKYKDETMKLKVYPISVVTRWNSWFKTVKYLCEYLYDIVEFVQSVGDESIAVKYFMALHPSEVKNIHSQAVMLSGHCSKCCNLLLCLEIKQTPQAHTLGSKLSELCKSFVFLKDGVFFEKTSAELSQFSKQGQVELTSTFKSVGEQSLQKLHQLTDSDLRRDFISSLGQLFDPRNVVQCALWHNDYCCFVDAAVKSLWSPVNNVDCEISFFMYSCVMSDRRSNLIPDNMLIKD
ncbi:hypothetical protein PR048_011686 [Dryococelus australis]|uniref:DUF659 domain-containing protein n=1 Tax=Dryococelus australis TaxID=614101 RepID=A0ABQ9HNJ9_9NEOP|nr:hypothetical protein PR048_011686 [Dryococelus australis]